MQQCWDGNSKRFQSLTPLSFPDAKDEFAPHLCLQMVWRRSSPDTSTLTWISQPPDLWEINFYCLQITQPVVAAQTGQRQAVLKQTGPLPTSWMSWSKRLNTMISLMAYHQIYTIVLWTNKKTMMLVKLQHILFLTQCLFCKYWQNF
jgi:hypothetical protein